MKIIIATIWTRISFVLSIIGLISVTDNLIQWAYFIRFITDKYIEYVREPIFAAISRIIYIPAEYHDLALLSLIMWSVASVGIYIKRGQNIFFLTWKTTDLIIRAISLTLHFISSLLMCIVDENTRKAVAQSSIAFWNSMFTEDTPKSIPFIVIPMIPIILILGAYSIYAIFSFDMNMLYVAVGIFFFTLFGASIGAWEWVLTTSFVFFIIFVSNFIYTNFLIS